MLRLLLKCSNAVRLIEKGKAYVCDLSPDECVNTAHAHRARRESPYRNRSVEENPDLF